jgi:hypothetical protein
MKDDSLSVTVVSLLRHEMQRALSDRRRFWDIPMQHKHEYESRSMCLMLAVLLPPSLLTGNRWREVITRDHPRFWQLLDEEV